MKFEYKDIMDIRNGLKLNSYEAKILIALLSLKVSKLAELSNITDVPRSRVYDIIESLKNKGYVKEIHHIPITVEIIPLNELLLSYQNNLKRDFESKTKELKLFNKSSIYKKLEKVYNEKKIPENDKESLSIFFRSLKGECTRLINNKEINFSKELLEKDIQYIKLKRIRRILKNKG